MPDDGARKRGFADLPPEERKEMARRGGAAVAAENRAFSRNKLLAQAAGRKGGSRRPGEGRGHE
jgi:uncharacterized protein